jgi:Helix-turn-helix domain
MKSIDELERLEVPISVKEAARIYGDSPGTFYRRVRRGEIPGAFREHGKPKARIKICPKVFAAFLRQQIAKGCRNEELAVQSTATMPASKGEESEQNGAESSGAGKDTGRRLRAASGR